MTTSTPLHHELKCLRTHIVDFLEYQLKNDLITEKRASQLAQDVLDQLNDNLNHDQIHQVTDSLEKKYPEEMKFLEASQQACETAQARRIIDNQVLNDISAGNLDSALAKLDAYKFK